MKAFLAESKDLPFDTRQQELEVNYLSLDMFVTLCFIMNSIENFISYRKQMTTVLQFIIICTDEKLFCRSSDYVEAKEFLLILEIPKVEYSTLADVFCELLPLMTVF